MWLPVQGNQLRREIEFLDKLDSWEKVLMPWDIWERIVGTSNRALEEDHTKRSFKDLRVVSVLAKRLAELRNGGKAVAYDIAVDLFALYPLGGLEMQCGNAQAAVKIGLVGF
jgi:hypothetical protein